MVISHQTQTCRLRASVSDLGEVARDFLKDTGMLTNKTKFYINPTGRL